MQFIGLSNTTTMRMRMALGEVVGRMALLISFCLLVLLGGATTSSRNTAFALEYPASIHLRAGVLVAPPFSTISSSDDKSPTFGGFQIDLLNRMKVFAIQDDNVNLTFDLTQTAQNYGKVFDLVANDCNTTQNPNLLQDCQQYDLIVADYYVNPLRSIRVDFSPSWLRTSMSTMKYLNKQEGNPDYTTLSEASKANAPVCLPGGTYIMEVVQMKWPDGTYLLCDGQDDCQRKLKSEECVLYVEDELQLHYRAANDPSLKVTGETFNTQYLVWAMKYSLDPNVLTLMKKWMYAAVANATMDELYFNYFQKELCPIGTAGENCELPCHPIHGTSNEMGICDCESQRWTGDDCSIEVLESMNHISRGLKLIGILLFSINCVLVVICATWLFWQRNSPQVRISQPFFLGLVLLGCFISSSTILVLGLEDDDDGEPPCMAIPWLYSVGFSITFGTLFAKIRRVYLIFKSAAGLRRGAVTWKETLSITALVLMIDISVLILWTAIDPLTWTRTIVVADKFGYPLESYGICTGSWVTFGSIIAVYHVILLGIASFMCYVARDIPGEFSESKYIAMSMISNFQILLIGIPVLILIGASDPSTSYFVRSAMIWTNDFMVVALIFGNLIRSVHFSETGNSNTKGDIKNMVGSAVKRYSEAQQNRRSSAGSGFFSTASQSGDSASAKNKYELTTSELGRLNFSDMDSLPVLEEEDHEEESTSFRVEQSPATIPEGKPSKTSVGILGGRTLSTDSEGYGEGITQEGVTSYGGGDDNDPKAAIKAKVEQVRLARKEKAIKARIEASLSEGPTASEVEESSQQAVEGDAIATADAVKSDPVLTVPLTEQGVEPDHVSVVGSDPLGKRPNSSTTEDKSNPISPEDPNQSNGSKVSGNGKVWW